MCQVNKDYQSPLMEAYVDEVRKLKERFDGLQTEHIPRAENNIVDDLSKQVVQKFPVEPGTFVLRLTQASVTPSDRQAKKRKINSSGYLPTELSTTTKRVAGNDKTSAGELQTPADPMVLVIEANAPAKEEMPLVLVVEPQAPAWAVQYIQTGELPEEQEETERVARRSSLYQFMDKTLYEATKWGEIEVHSPGRRTIAAGRNTRRNLWLPPGIMRPCRESFSARLLLAHNPSRRLGGGDYV